MNFCSTTRDPGRGIPAVQAEAIAIYEFIVSLSRIFSNASRGFIGRSERRLEQGTQITRYLPQLSFFEFNLVEELTNVLVLTLNNRLADDRGPLDPRGW